MITPEEAKKLAYSLPIEDDLIRISNEIKNAAQHGHLKMIVEIDVNGAQRNQIVSELKALGYRVYDYDQGLYGIRIFWD